MQGFEGGEDRSKSMLLATPHKSMRPIVCVSLLQDLLWKLVNTFTPIWMWAAAVHICMCNEQILKGGKTAMKGGKIPPP